MKRTSPTHFSLFQNVFLFDLMFCKHLLEVVYLPDSLPFFFYPSRHTVNTNYTGYDTHTLPTYYQYYRRHQTWLMHTCTHHTKTVSPGCRPHAIGNRDHIRSTWGTLVRRERWNVRDPGYVQTHALPPWTDRSRLMYDGEIKYLKKRICVTIVWMCKIMCFVNRNEQKQKSENVIL